MVIFRQGPPRVQSYQAELEQKEGWFDDEGWRIDDPNDDDQRNWWFPDPSLKSGESPRPLAVVVGKGRPWSREAWVKAAAMWSEHGYLYGLELTPERLSRYENLARQGSQGGLALQTNPDLMNNEWYQAALGLQYYQQNRNVTNYPFFVASSAAEAQAATVRARKTLWQAEQARKLGKKPLATRLYLDGLEQWKKVLAGNKEFHRPERSDRIDEQTYEYELAYLRLLVQDDERVREKANEIVAPCRAVVPFLSDPYPQTLRQTQLAANEKVRAAAPSFLRELVPVPYPRALSQKQLDANAAVRALRAVASPYVPFLPDPFPGDDDSPTDTPQWTKDAREEIKWHVAETFFSPFAGVMSAEDVSDDRRGGPWVRSDIKESVRVNIGVQRKTPQPAQEPSGPAQPKENREAPPGGN